MTCAPARLVIKYDSARPVFLLYYRLMSYLVFARKYRPMTFEDIVAQEHVTKTLQNAVKNDRVGSGYLFCGPRGTGKTTTARVLAKALNCVDGPTPKPCGGCAVCREITAGTSLDVLEIDAASNTGVDDVRALRENVRYLPTGGKKRIYVIDEVHRLSGPAFDALLKTLEEPPPHVIFILATTDPLKVPETILSRTQRFDFRRVSLGDLVSHLKNIARKENIRIDDAAVKLIARKADGSVRDSLSLMDQIAAYAGQEMTEKDVIAALGLVDKQMLYDFTTAVASRDSKAVLNILDRVFEAGVDARDFMTELLEHFRILLVLATNREAADLSEFSADQWDLYREQSQYFSVGDIIRLMKIGADVNRDLREGLDERLALEMSGVKMAEMEATVRFEDILEHLQRSQPAQSDDLFGAAEKKKSDRPILTSGLADTQPGSAPGAASEPSGLSIEGLSPGLGSRPVNLPVIESGWDNFLNLLRQRSQMLASLMSMGEVRQVKDNTLRLVFPAAGSTNKQVVEKADNLNLILGTLREHYKSNLSIKFEIDPEKNRPSNSLGNNSLSKEDVDKLVENSPRLKKLIERVDGEVIGIRKVK